MFLAGVLHLVALRGELLKRHRAFIGEPESPKSKPPNRPREKRVVRGATPRGPRRFRTRPFVVRDRPTPRDPAQGSDRPVPRGPTQGFDSDRPTLRGPTQDSGSDRPVPRDQVQGSGSDRPVPRGSTQDSDRPAPRDQAQGSGSDRPGPRDPTQGSGSGRPVPKDPSQDSGSDRPAPRDPAQGSDRLGPRQGTTGTRPSTSQACSPSSRVRVPPVDGAPGEEVPPIYLG